MRTIYAIQLHVCPPDTWTPGDCFADLVTRIGQWVEGKYQRQWNARVSLRADGCSATPLPGHHLLGTMRVAENTELFTLEWTHPADDDPSTAWVTNCVVARHGQLVQLAVILRLSTTKVVLRPVRFDLGRPRLVNELLANFSVSMDHWPVPTKVEALSSPQVQPYVENVLLNANRNLPVVMVSPDVWSGRYSVEPSTLLQRLMGFAHVAALSDKWAAFKLTDIVDKPLSCYDGAIRLYWPGFTLQDSPFPHKLFFPQSIRLHDEQGLPLPDHLFRTLSAVASYRYTEGSVIRDAHKAIAELERRRVEELREKIRAGAVEKDGLENQLLGALERIDQLTVERDQYKADLAAQQTAWAEVQQAMAAGGPEASEPRSESRPRFNTVLDAVEEAKKNFTGPLLFLDSALESAKDSPYKDPDRAYEIFEALALVAEHWRKHKGALGQSWNDAISQLGFDLRDQISMTSKGKYGDQYKFMYKGQRCLFEKHITIGAKQADKCLSVHWYRDDDDLVLAIGHCGRHLSNTTA